MKGTKILLTDELHFHTRNFGELFSFFEKNSFEVRNAKAPKDWISLYGNYFVKSAELRPTVLELARLNQEDLFLYSYKGINLFETARMEFLAFVIAKPAWKSFDISKGRRYVFNHAIKCDYDSLLHNLAAVIHWIDWWEKKIKDVGIHHFCCIFSGSLIYGNSLIQILKKHSMKPLVMESFFTGNEFYMECIYRHIPNNSDLKFKNFYDSLDVPVDANLYDRERLKSINKISGAKNKNVTQPVCFDLFEFDNDRKTILILGQVLNDFSLLGNDGVNSLLLYKRLISDVLSNTDFNLIFKAHPWEKNKIGIGRDMTREEIEIFVAENFSDNGARIKMFSDYNINSIFEQSDYVVTICSQSAIEAAFNGFKPILVADAFFGRKGFTYELVDESLSGFLSCDPAGVLSLKEFDFFEEFCVKVFSSHLVCVNPSGSIRLRDIFSRLPPISLVQSKSSSLLDEKLKQENPPTLESVPVFSAAEEKVSVSTFNDTANVETEEVLTCHSEIGVLSRKSRLIRKLKNNPHDFFADSSYSMVRIFRLLFK
tara:strand:- start:3075 stop:4697 length:1623 start_codon:yes stop_codon:yes gene_type:complete